MKESKNKIINKMHEKGLFDDNYDHIVLKESKEDRIKLQEKLTEEREEHNIEGYEKQHDSYDYKSRIKLEKEEGILETITLNILSFFFGEKSQIKAFFLRMRIKKILVRENAYYYDFRIKKLKASLPNTIYKDIYLNIRDINFLFEEVFKKKETIDYGKKIFLLDLVYPLLSEETKGILDSINDNYFKELITSSVNPSKVFEERLIELKHSILQHDTVVINAYTRLFETLLLISQFDFYKFFKLFDHHFSDFINYIPKFGGIFGTNTAEQLKQLNSYFSLLKNEELMENPVSHFETILNTIKAKAKAKANVKEATKGQEQTELASDHDSIQSAYSRIGISRDSINYLVDKIAFFNKKSIFELIIKLMTNQYDYELIKIRREKDLLLNAYIDLVVDKQRYLFKTSYETIRNSIIHKEIFSLFNITSIDELISIAHYSERVNRELIEKRIGQFNYVEPIRVLNTFFHKKYKAFQKVIYTLVTDGDFVHKREGKLFKDCVYKLNKQLYTIKDFEDKLFKEYTLVKKIIDDNEQDYKDKLLINKYITNIEMQGITFLQESIKEYKTLIHFLEKIEKDISSLKPLFIVNIKSIYGTSNSRFLRGFELALSNVKQLFKIMTFYPVMEKIRKG